MIDFIKLLDIDFALQIYNYIDYVLVIFKAFLNTQPNSTNLYKIQHRRLIVIKDGEKGPIVWEVKSAPFYRKQGKDGLPKQAHTLIVARNVLNPEEIKYFLANQSLQSPHVTLKDLLWVAFSRWPIERCFEIGKRDLGMDHFEMRQWTGIHRHFYISQLTQLFCGQVQQALREKNSEGTLSNGRTGSLGRQHLDYSSTSEPLGPIPFFSKNSRCDNVLSNSQSRCTSFPLEKNQKKTRSFGYQCQ